MDDYVKIVYQSEPIGRERIILYLTTFDIESFNENVNLDEIPKKPKVMGFNFDKLELDSPDFVDRLEQNINRIVRNEYDAQLKIMEEYIKTMRKNSEYANDRIIKKKLNPDYSYYGSIDFENNGWED